MGLQETPNVPNLYPKALQIKLYQAFIFSIPILFSIILFLLFYLFYLKRRASSLTSPPPLLPRTFNNSTTSLSQSTCGKDLIIEKLPKVLFDEELGARDSQCCVCLGEFEIKEELIQMPSCNHIFHVECILHWLRSNSTCPICRCLITSSDDNIIIINNNNNNNNNDPRFSVSTEPLNLGANRNSNSANADVLQEGRVIPVDEIPSTSESTCIRDISISA